MWQIITKSFSKIDWILFSLLLPICVFGLFTMNSIGTFSGQESYPFLERQIFWLIISFAVFVIASQFSYNFLKKPTIVFGLYVLTVAILLLLYIVGSVFKGAQSWLDFGFFAFQPVELAKIVLIIVLAKYFSKRHVEIAHFKHILVSGIYTFVIFALVLFQPDFGSAMIIFFIWLSMILFSGVSKKHLVFIFALATIGFLGAWFLIFNDYQKDRIMTFLNPLAGIQGAGYNAYQSTIAVGSGGLWGKGVGYGTQSRLQFLPEYETDFIFAAFAEEWGFVGVILLFVIFISLIVYITFKSTKGRSNFESLFGLGLASMFLCQFIVHVGMNIGLLPVTGLTFPFMSYGGSHLLIGFLSLGVLSGMTSHGRESFIDEGESMIV